MILPLSVPALFLLLLRIQRRAGKGSHMHSVFHPLLGHRRMGLGPGTFPYQDMGSPHSLCGSSLPCFRLTRYPFVSPSTHVSGPQAPPSLFVVQTPGEGRGSLCCSMKWGGGVVRSHSSCGLQGALWPWGTGHIARVWIFHTPSTEYSSHQFGLSYLPS